MAETDDDLPVKTHDGAILDMVKMVINSIVKDSENAHGASERERLKNQIKLRSDPAMVGAINALSTYGMARAAERQATAMESIAKTAKGMAMVDTVDTNAQAMVDLRESKRDYLATTYSLSPRLLSLLWAMRGMLMDASVRSLSRPDRFDPYRRLSTDEIAWSLRVATDEFLADLPRTATDEIDYGLLEEFDIMHYGGTPDAPDDWMYGG